jgi:hypothetical protein
MLVAKGDVGFRTVLLVADAVVRDGVYETPKRARR